MSELIRKLDDVPGVYAQAYADDVLLMATGIDSFTISGRVQEGIEAVRVWADETQMELLSAEVNGGGDSACGQGYLSRSDLGQ